MYVSNVSIRHIFPFIYPLIKNREILRLVSDDIFKGDCYMLERLESLVSRFMVGGVCGGAVLSLSQLYGGILQVCHGSHGGLWLVLVRGYRGIDKI